ncbi:hypothetical protein HanRHA438_Chr08g0369151 [Helianthus annuus]|nr:hypothetical protein HanLR1_Chr08g0293691 [Helianthus annuus]KAJ0899488.1 hypothetical protein HanRHA438_Chr08g0369151 [Helianthus annuus]
MWSADCRRFISEKTNNTLVFNTLFESYTKTSYVKLLKHFGKYLFYQIFFQSYCFILLITFVQHGESNLLRNLVQIM